MGGGSEVLIEKKLVSCVGGDEIAQTIDASYYKGPGSRNGKEREVIVEEPVMMSDRKGHNGITEDGTSTTLTAQQKDRPLVACDVYNQSIQGETAATVTAETGVPNHSGPKLMGQSIVRRLTPLECERLQGFPDGWTDIGEWTDSKGKKHETSDSSRYKALGNSIALPFWQFLARRICAQYERPITMGSLFDGIGGFPLCFERCGAKAVWASEIEEFPIAVTKQHFSESKVQQ